MRFFGMVAVGAFFLALLATLAVIFPLPNAYKQDELTSMRQARKSLKQRKTWGLGLGLVCFLIGMAYLAALIGRILWTL